MKKMKEENAKVEALKKGLRECTQERNNLIQPQKKLKKDVEEAALNLQKAQELVKSSKEDKATATTELEGTQATISNLCGQLTSQRVALEAEIETSKISAADQYEDGFNATLGQVHIIALTVDFSEAYVWKEIIDGKLVSPPSDNAQTADASEHQN